MSDFSSEDKLVWRRLLLIRRGLLLALLGGLALLLVEIRYEHQAVLGDKWQSWIPIVSLPVILILASMGMFAFRALARKLLIGCFVGLAMVGLLGFWFHSKGKPVQGLIHIAKVDLGEPGHILEQTDDTNPPLLAPLSLVGLGLIGVLASCIGPSSGSIRARTGKDAEGGGGDGGEIK